MRQYFEQKNPYALQDMASVMLETAYQAGLVAPP